MFRFLSLFVILPLAAVSGQTCPDSCVKNHCKKVECVEDQCVYSNNPDFTICIKNSNLGRCHGGECSIGYLLQGCQASNNAADCLADSTCSWETKNPASCPNGGCPNANCAVISTLQKSMGFTCDNCFVSSKAMFCGDGVKPTTGICQTASTSGSGGCRDPHPIKLRARGSVINGLPISATLLTADHTESIEVGYLKDFSSVVVPGAPTGEVYRLNDNTIHKGDEIIFQCPESCDNMCEVYVMTYHCPSCPASVKSNVIATAQAEGWEVSSCAPELYIGTDGVARPMITLRTVLTSGSAASFPSVEDANFVLILAFSRKLTDCRSYDRMTCETVAECKYFNNYCTLKEWCPKRFSRGPHVGGPGPKPPTGCAATCLDSAM